MAKPMTLKDIRDNLSRMFAQNRKLESTEVNHVLIEDTHGVIHIDYMLKDESSDVVEDDEEDDYVYDDIDDDDSELEDWEDGDDEDSELY